MMALPFLKIRIWFLIMTMLPDIHAQTSSCQQPCQNGGQCTATQSGQFCVCPVDFTGTMCETSIDDCLFPTQNQCQHNSQCTDGVGNYSCVCLSGWEGRFCEKEKNECESNPCKNGGICRDVFDGFECSCTTNYTGQTCSEDVDECSQATRPCRNGATCGNTNGGFNCICVPGYTGILCETEINECSSSPCHFGGLCTDLVNNFRCDCLPGFMGATCEAVVRQCELSSQLCGENGICIDQPQGDYQCFCKPGYYGTHCEFVANLCVSKPCRNGATCVNNRVNYTCSCAPGYTGKNCEANIDECASAPCLNNGTCQEVMPSGFMCQCLPGFSGNKCETDINECESNPCQGQQLCIDLVNGYRCECPIGTTGALCETVIFDCRQTVCINGGVCSQEGGSYICVCPSPYTDQTCATSLDPCTPNPCLYGGSCYRVNNTDFGCVCTDGFVGQRCEADIYDCFSNPCLNGGTCEEVLYGENAPQNAGDKNENGVPGNAVGGATNQSRIRFTCSCPANFTGTLCEMEFLACLSNPCKHGATCISRTRTEFACECPGGWTGTVCDKDINECLIMPSVCLNGGQCINKTPGFSCVCPQHWTGKSCEADLQECAVTTCLNNGTCIENIGKPSQCACVVGYTGSDCSVRLSNCVPDPCQNNATCKDNISENNTGFTCQCLPGYTGQLCDGNIDECTILKPCMNNGTCLDAINGYNCHCQPGWTGLRCEQDIDDCISGACQNGGNCTDLINGFSCECAFGYAGQNCSVEVNECSYDPCQNNATCEDLVDGFICQCMPGYTGVACSHDIDECTSFPCAGAATCVDGINTFTCLCPLGFQGSLCDQDIPECSSSPCKYGGTCTEPAPASFSCSCLPGIQGVACEIVGVANFDGSKAVMLTSLLQFSNGGRTATRMVRDVVGSGEIQVQFTFTTTALDGLLLVTTGTYSSGQPQHVALELRNSILYISASNGLQLLRDSVKLTNSFSEIYNYVVQMTLSDTLLDLSLTPSGCNSGDSNCQLTVKLLFVNASSWNFTGAVYFGGVTTFTPYLRNLVREVGGFVGCLGNLLINGQLVNLASESQNAEVMAPEYGCPSHSPCLEGSCANGGTCQDTWINKTCDCRPGYSGPTCNFQNMAHFEPSSMLHFEVNAVISEIIFSLSSANATGLIMYTVTMDSLSLSLDNGQLRLYLIRYNAGRTMITGVGNNLHLHDWVRVVLKLSSNTYTLEVSSNTSGSLGSATGTTGDSILVTGSLFWGTLLNESITDKWKGTDNPLPSQQSIRGCIRDIFINGIPLDLSTSTPISSSRDPPKARPGCEVEERCLNNSCLNDGVCVASWAGPVCKCSESYAGENCSQASSSTFDGKSSYSLVYLDRTKTSFGEEGGLEFRTRDVASTVMLLQFLSLTGLASHFIEFRISSGKLQSYSSISKDTKESNTDVSDGQWHSLYWVRRNNYFDLNLDGTHVYLQTDFDPYQATVNNTMQVFIGSRPYFPGNASVMAEFFKGCMRGISFDNVSIPFSSKQSTQPGLIIIPVALVSSCQGDVVCGTNSCPANSYCVDQWNSFVCPCLEGWEGVACASSVDDCKNNSCQNGGICVDGHLSYTCVCSQNYTGNFCETNFGACNVNPCHINNTVSCSSLNATDFKCNCLPGYAGKICDSLIDNCAYVPCANNGTCKNGVNNFTCICRDGFLGAVCDIVDFCFSQPCFNGGTCLLQGSGNETLNTSMTTRLLNQSQSSLTAAVGNNATVTSLTIDSFLCVCIVPYFGSQCQSYDYCYSNPCHNNASCVLDVNKFHCECLVGFYGVYCENNDFCASKPCLNGGTCSNNADSYSCLCLSYYTGINCENPLNQCLNNSCQNGGTCVFNMSALTSGQLPLAFTTNDSITCVCPEKYTGPFCETEISQCDSSPCLHNGTCAENFNQSFSEKFNVSFTCVCVPGYEGERCESDIDECYPKPCQNGGVCIDLVNNFSCSCLSGFSGRICDVDLRGCESSPCQNHAECRETADNYTCICPPGFTGLYCEVNIDDCMDNKCTHSGKCLDGINNYTCACFPGYSGLYCTDIIDSCHSQPCFNNGVCSYQGKCSCADVVKTCGWYNETCQTQLCVVRQECRTQSPSYLCNCSGTGYTGPQCAEDVNECEQEPRVCHNNGTCTNTVGSFLCDCRGTGYNDSVCETDENECDGKNSCFNGGTCINIPGSFECVCSYEWEGQTCGQNKNDCVSNPCEHGGQCIDELGGYSCSCNNTGFEGVNCSKNVDDCVNNQCENGGYCVDGIRSYTCVCNGTGYTGRFCQTEQTTCEPPPCKNNGTCSESNTTIACNCSNTGFTGKFCESAAAEPQSADQSGLSEGAVIALIIISIIIIIILIVVAVWLLRRRRKTRGRYKPAEMEGHVTNGDIHMNRLNDRRERMI